MKKRTMIDLVVLAIVVIIAGIIIALSFGNTAKLAEGLGLNPYLTAGLVEALFASLLFIRGRQRATQRNVPIFLEAGYWISLGFVTAVNMWGLAQENAVIGSIVGLAISGAMWLMEQTLVWLWTDSHSPYEQSVGERMREAKKIIAEEKVIQNIEWLKWEAKKPDLKLIEKARKAEEKREETVGDGLPEFFLQQPEQNPIEVVAKPVIVDIEEDKKAEVIPMRQIGFQMQKTEEKTMEKTRETAKETASRRFRANEEKRAKAIETARRKAEELGRIPTPKELMSEGLSKHYSQFAIRSLEQ